MPDVIIAGAGPVGLLLAAELAQAGVDVLVAEPRTVPAAHSDGMAIHARSLAALDLRGVGETIRSQAFEWPRAPFSLLWLDLDAGTELDRTLGFPQWRTTEVLAEHAQARGATIRRGVRVTGLVPDETGVTVALADYADGTETVRAGWVVGCDGAGSAVRELSRIRLTGDSPSYYGVLGDIPLTEKLYHLFNAGPRQGGLFGALPISEGMIRLMSIEFDHEPPTAGTPVSIAELAAAIGRLNGSEPEIDEAVYLSRFGGASRLADRYRAGRVFVAGDAAHPLFISGTQALNAGLQDALNLGWKLAAVIQGRMPEDLLDTYEAERRPAGRRALAHAEATVAMFHPLDRVSPLRDLMTELLAYSDVSRHLLRMPAEVRYVIEYPGRPAQEAHPLVGSAVNNLSLVTATGKTTIAATLTNGHGVLLDLRGDRADKRDGPDIADAVDVITAEPIPALGVSRLLVRPDGYIAFADLDGTDDRGLDLALERWFGPVGSGQPALT